MGTVSYEDEDETENDNEVEDSYGGGHDCCDCCDKCMDEAVAAYNCFNGDNDGVMACADCVDSSLPVGMESSQTDFCPDSNDGVCSGLSTCQSECGECGSMLLNFINCFFDCPLSSACDSDPQQPSEQPSEQPSDSQT